MENVKIGIQRVKKMGSLNYLTVPKKIVDVGIIDESQEYLVVLIPQNKEKLEVSA